MTTSSSSTFAHAPITKSLIIGSCLSSLLLSGHKQLLDVPLKPHLTRDFQIWRILVHHFVCSNSSDLFLIVLILWNTSIQVERRFGSLKYASFLLVSIGLGSIFELIALSICYHLFQYRAIPAGPFLITFAITYQYQKIVPTLYDYRIGKLELNSNSLIPNLLSIILFFFNPISTLLGLSVSSIYRSDQFRFKHWRLRQIPFQTSTRRPVIVGRSNHAVLEDDPRLDVQSSSISPLNPRR